MRIPLLLSVLALFTAAPTALVACSHSEDSTSSSESNATAAENQDNEKGEEGSVCWAAEDCAEGLLCKARPHGPPPGAVGLPLPSGSATHHGPPPGAVGMPLPPNTCQTPAPGEEGSRCRSADECNEGLVCEMDSGSSSSGGPPPGAMGMPAPSSTGHAFPPGAMGMPILHYGKCAKDEASSSSSGGPPPGALGLPIHH